MEVINISRLERNLMAYMDEDMIPKMPKLEGIALGAIAPLVIRAKLPALLRMAAGTELLSGDNGENVDVELLYKEFKRSAAGKYPLEIAGFRFDENDIDKLYRYLIR